MRKIIGSIAFMFLILSGVHCHAQKYCQQAKLEFTDANAPEALKKLTLERLIQNIKNKKQQADIQLLDGVIIAKIPCDGNEVLSRYFPSEKFAIGETYEVAEIKDAIEGMAAISERWGVPFDNLIDPHFAQGASIGICPINRIVQFRTLADMTECKKLLPADLAFAFGMPEKDASAVPVFAIKVVKDPPITITMMKDARTSLSFNEVHHDVQLEFKKEYKTTWEAFTKKNSGRCVAIMLGDAVLSCPMLMAPIANGKAAISANMDKWQAEEMAQRINFSLPLEVLITEVKMLD